MKLHPFERGKNPLLILLKLMLTVYIGVGVVLWLAQEVLIFPGLWLHRASELSTVTWAEPIDADGARYLLAHPEHDRMVLLAHGNGEWAGQLQVYADKLHAEGWATAFFEYRGYAGVPGWPTESGMSADVKRVLDDLDARGFPPEKIVLHGRSIGGGVIGTALDHVKPAGLVLESTFDSLEEVVRDRNIGRAFPLSLLLRSPLRTADRIRRSEVPVFQVHDTTDGVVSIERARGIHGPGITTHETTGHPHGTPLVLLVPQLNSAWRGWLEDRVPR